MGRFGKFTADPPGSVAAASELKTGARGEAISALINLGYSQSEAARAVAAASRETPDADTGSLIKAALKELSPA